MSGRLKAWMTIILGACFVLAGDSGLSARQCESKTDVPLVKLLPPPPCETCEETKAELDELTDIEKARTTEDEKQANLDVERSVARFLTGADLTFDPVKLKNCEGFFLKRRAEEKAIVDAAKDSFCRLRPFLTHGNVLHPVEGAKPDDSFSYPSGHATYAATIGFLLAEMVPEKRSEIYGRINSYARSRMIAGVHFRSDLEAGKLIGAAITAAYLAGVDSRSGFEEAKACVRGALGLQ